MFIDDRQGAPISNVATSTAAMDLAVQNVCMFLIDDSSGAPSLTTKQKVPSAMDSAVSTSCTTNTSFSYRKNCKCKRVIRKNNRQCCKKKVWCCESSKHCKCKPKECILKKKCLHETHDKQQEINLDCVRMAEVDQKLTLPEITQFLHKQREKLEQFKKNAKNLSTRSKFITSDFADVAGLVDASSTGSTSCMTKNIKLSDASTMSKVASTADASCMTANMKLSDASTADASCMTEEITEITAMHSFLKNQQDALKTLAKALINGF